MMENKKHEILLGLTTTPGSDWRGKVEEMKKFGIKRIALFPTFLDIEDREELYKMLENIKDLEIPHVHLRSDMELWELEMLEKKYKTEVFNIHATLEFPVPGEYLKYAKKIYLENTPGFMPSEDDMSNFAGYCIDFSHWEDGKKREDSLYNGFTEKIESSFVGCCHLSAIVSKPLVGQFHHHDKNNQISDSHYFSELAEFDYLQDYRRFFSHYLSLELENSFEEQLRVKNYLEKILWT